MNNQDAFLRERRLFLRERPVEVKQMTSLSGGGRGELLGRSSCETNEVQGAFGLGKFFACFPFAPLAR